MGSVFKLSLHCFLLATITHLSPAHPDTARQYELHTKDSTRKAEAWSVDEYKQHRTFAEEGTMRTQAWNMDETSFQPGLARSSHASPPSLDNDGLTEQETTMTEAWRVDENNNHKKPSIELSHAALPTHQQTNKNRLREEPTNGGLTRERRFLGINIGDESTNFQAGMWLLGLVGVLAAALPVVFLDPSLAYRRKREVLENNSEVLMRRLVDVVE